MNNRKRLVSILLLGMILLLGGCSGIEAPSGESTETGAIEETEPVVRLSMATSGNWTNVIRGKVFNKYCRKLEEWSDGKLTMSMYDMARLGDDMELLEGVQLGTLNIINSVPGYQCEAVPEAALLDLPGIFTSVEQYNAMMDDGYFDVMQQYYNQAGLQLLSSYCYSFRQVSSNFPIYSMEDFQDLRIRTIENKYHIKFWESVGATAIPLPYSEVFMALRQRNMEAQENPLYNLVSSNLAEVQNYVIFTYHAPMVSNFVMNKDQYDALSDENKELLRLFFEGDKEDVIRQMPGEDQQLQSDLKSDYDLTMIYPDEELLQSLWACNTEVLEMLRTELGDAVVDEFLAAAEAARLKVSEGVS